MLKEAFRVLKEGGIMGLTVYFFDFVYGWVKIFGRRENCTCMTIFKDTGIAQGMDPTKFP